MPTSPRSSSTSASCRFELRPSRLGQAALLGLAGLGAFCALAWPSALLLGVAARAQLRRYRRMPACVVDVVPESGRMRCDGQPLRALRLRVRGPLTFVGWQRMDGRWTWRLFWPDRLDAAQRRELQLAIRRLAPAANAGSVAG